MKFQVFKFSSFFILLICLYSNKLQAQGMCGTITPSNHVFTTPPSSATSTQTNYSLPIHFHIITSNGTLPGIYDYNSGQPTGYNIVKQIRSAINFANGAYLGGNINFYPSAITYFESNSLYNKGHDLQGLYNLVHDDDAINVYLVNAYTNSSGIQDGVIGETYLPYAGNPTNNAISLKAFNSNNFNHTLAHELGHYFNLMHTHEGTTYLTSPEDNCNERGDKICDTPQDALSDGCPNTIYDCSGCTDCNSSCTVRDKRTNPATIIRVFSPDKKNIMSYYDQCLVDHFSPMQLSQIRNTLLTNAFRSFLIQGPNPPSVPIPVENAYVYRTVLSSTGSVTNVSQFGDIGVQLSKTGVAPTTSTTPSIGGPFDVDKGIFLPQNITAKISPARNGTVNLAANNGVSTFDLIKLQQHILGTSLLPKPYAWIAAGVNNNGVISNTDQIKIQQLILNQITSFPDVPSWRMVPTFALQNTVFLNEFNNDPFSAIWTTSTGEYLGYNLAVTGGTKTYFDDLQINLTNPNINQSSTFSFQAIKSGDLNFSAIVNSANTFRSEGNVSELRTDGKYRLQSADFNCLEPGQSYSIGIGARGNVNVYAYQMGIKFDHKVINISGVDRGDSKFFSLDNFNISNLNEGELRTVWLDFYKNEKINVNEKKNLFRIIAVPQTKVCDLSQVFQLKDQTLENLFYDENGRPIDLELILSAEEIKKGDETNDLLVNVYPNPTNGEINFELNLQVKTKVDIMLRDSYGKTITVNKTINSGISKVSLNQELSNLHSGIIYYSLSLGSKPYSGTFFKL